jgi:hypothetical protein
MKRKINDFRSNKKGNSKLWTSLKHIWSKNNLHKVAKTLFIYTKIAFQNQFNSAKTYNLLYYLPVDYDVTWICTTFRRRVICSKFICSKNLLDTKISTARHRSSRRQKYTKLLENQKSMPYVSCWADASFRPKLTTARIASARQKIKKMSTARQYF